MSGRTDRGVVLIVVLMTMLLLMAMGGALVLTTSVDTRISLNFRDAYQTLYAADAAAEWAVVDLAAAAPDWPTLLDESISSSFVDGPPGGDRALVDGSLVDLTAVVDANASWRPYAYGGFKDLLPGSDRPSPAYVVVFVAGDPSSAERLNVRVEAFGPRGAHKVLTLNLSRGPAGVAIESWREVR